METAEMDEPAYLGMVSDIILDMSVTDLVNMVWTWAQMCPNSFKAGLAQIPVTL